MGSQYSDSSHSTVNEDEQQAQLELASDQFAAILACIAEGVTVQDASGRLVYANDAAAQLSGFASGQALVTGSTAEALRRFEILDQDGQPFPAERLPGRLVLRGAVAPEVIVRFRPWGGGQERWSVINSTPVLDSQGAVKFAVNIFRDITERKRSEDTARFLAEASRVLSESLDYEVTLDRVAHLAVPTLADWCVVDVVEEHRIRRLAIAHADTARQELARELQQRYPEEPDAANGVGAVLRSGKAEVVSEITEAMLEAGARDPEHLRLLQALELRSYLIAPLLARGRTLGAITFVAAESGRHYGERDLILVEELAGRAALALDNARLYREAQEQAETHVLLNASLRDVVGERDEAVAGLQDALRTRDEFLASAAHDLKNPLAAIKAQVQLLGRQAQAGRTPRPARIVEVTRRVDATISRAAAQVEELLDLTRLDMGQPVALDLQHCDLLNLVAEVLDERRQLGSPHELDLESGEVELVGFFDRRRLSRLLGNLLDNAIRYSPDGGRVALRVERSHRNTGDLAAISVQDDGIGIPTEDLPYIFDRFRRGQNVVGRIPGTGIGLAGARWIAESHGGTLTVRSQLGKGSTFILELPLEAADVHTQNVIDPLTTRLQ